MDALNALSLQLMAHNEGALKAPFAEPAALRELRRKLERQYGSADSRMPPKNLRLAAVRRFLETNSASTARELKWLCFSVTDVVGRYAESLLTDNPAFTALMRHVRAAAGNPRLFRKCYLGLLHSYLTHDGFSGEDGPAEANWLTIRKFLRSSLADVSEGTHVPQWALDLKEHDNLLTERPCARYSASLLQGDEKELAAVRSALSVPESSWLVRESLLSAVEHGCGKGDGPFRAVLPSLVALLRRHELIQARGLAAVLNRYSQLKSPDFHSELHDFSINTWGNPLLQINQPRWHIAGEDATRMVTYWLKGRLIEDFFELLSVDGGTDRSRVEFWKRYRESITDMYFALGKDARTRRSEDFVRLRRTMGTSMLRLEGPSSSNNAFMMVMNGFVVTEFGQKGNAGFVFNRDNMPFELRGTVVESGKSNWPYVERLLHTQYSNGRTWQDVFEQVLRTRVGVVPDELLASRSKAREPARPMSVRTTTRAEGVAPASPAKSIEPAPPRPSTESERISDWRLRLSEYGVTIHESSNEYAVVAGRSNVRLTMLLTELGFKYARPNEWIHLKRK